MVVNSVVRGKLTLCDLAGSEDVGRSGATGTSLSEQLGRIGQAAAAAAGGESKGQLTPTDVKETPCLWGRCAQPEEPTGLAWVLAVGLLASGGDAFSILPMIMLLYLGGAFN